MTRPRPDDDAHGAWLRAITTCPVLGPEQETALALRLGQAHRRLVALGEGAPPEDQAIARQELDRARDGLVSGNLRLVLSIARRYQGRGLPLSDLVQEGSIGLMRAAERFDPARGVRFGTYATWWVRQAVQSALVRQGPSIRVPGHAVDRLRSLHRSARDFAARHGREPRASELAADLGLPEDKVRTLLAMVQDVVSLDAPLVEGEVADLGDVIADEVGRTPAEALAAKDLVEVTHEALGLLDARERAILEWRFGIGREERTLEELEPVFGITRERIRQIEATALRKLNRSRGTRKLRAWMEG